jgi:protein TonB
VDGEVEAKDLVYSVTPEISPETVDARASGTVVLHAIIGNDGRPQELQYISGSPFLVKSAMEAVKWWQYRVRLVDGEAVEVDTTIQVSFPALAD